MDQQLVINSTKVLNLSSANDGLILPLNGARRVLLSVTGLVASGAELQVNGSDDNGVSYPYFKQVGTNNIDLISATNTAVTINGDYLMLTGMYTHVRIFVSQTGTGTCLVTATTLSVSEMMQYNPRDWYRPLSVLAFA